MLRADKNHLPSPGLEPTGEMEERKTMVDMKKNIIRQLKTISMIWEEAKRTAKD